MDGYKGEYKHEILLLLRLATYRRVRDLHKLRMPRTDSNRKKECVVFKNGSQDFFDFKLRGVWRCIFIFFILYVFGTKLATLRSNY